MHRRHNLAAALVILGGTLLGLIEYLWELPV